MANGQAGLRDRRTLGDYITLQRGTTYKSQLLGEPGPALLGLASIQRNGGFRRDSLQTYGGDSPKKLLVLPGDLYVSLKDVTQSGDLLGAVARLPDDHPPGRLTQDTVKLEPVGDDVPLNYLYWLLRTPQYRAYCRARATGTTNLGLAREDFLAFPAPEPTAIQRLVVATLDAIDNKSELNRRLNETLEGIARAMFKSWFVDFDPVRAKMEGRPLSGLGTEFAGLFPDNLTDSELGPIPRGWPISSIGEEYQYVMGQSPPGSSYNETGEGVLLFQGKGEFGFRYPTVRLFCTEPKRMASAGDTLVSVRAPVGAMNLARVECCIGRGLAAVRHKSGSASFTYYSLRELTDAFTAYDSEGTVFGSINKKDFGEIRCLQIPESLVLRADELLSPIDALIEEKEEEQRTLAELRDSLLPRLVSGEIRVEDAEQLTESVV